MVNDQYFFDLIQQEEREKVSPKLELFRDRIIGGKCPDNIMMKGVRGGRGAGAKSWGLTSLLVQEANYTCQRIACFREIQKTLNESVYHLIEETVDRLKYPGWEFKSENIKSPTGSLFIFRGLKDLTASKNVKGLEGFTRFHIEEGSSISIDSIMYLLPTLFRNEAAKLYFCYNQDMETDPITTEIWNIYKDELYSLFIECLPCGADNPWWNDKLEKLSQKLKKIDPELWDHVYGGNPLSQLHNAAISRLLIRQAMDRIIQVPEGSIEIGLDPADKGDDKTQAYKRKGYKVIDSLTLRKMNGEYIANEVWTKLAKKRPDVPIKVDETGIGTSTRDNLKRLGAKVIPINFGSNARKKNEYPNLVSEMWFDFDRILPELDIPNDPELMSDLSSRLYNYDGKGRRLIEPKKEFKVRFHRSPDKGDALLLCFYEGRNIIMTEDRRNQLKKRWRR